MNGLKATFNKVKLDDTKSNEIRSKLMNGKTVSHMWLIPVAAVLSAMVIVMVIPSTRNIVVNAAEKIIQEFKIYTGNGDVIARVTDPDTGKTIVEYYFEDSSPSYARVKDGRLYFVLNDEWTDVTDICSETTYYRYEIKHEDGIREVIFVGGKVGVNTYGWIEIIYDAEDNYVVSVGKIPSSDPDGYQMSNAADFEWVKNARRDEDLIWNNHRDKDVD